MENIQVKSSALSSSSSSLSSSCRKKYRGVRMRSWGSWVSEIRAPNQKTRIWLGSYSTAEAAARAYDAALLCLKGSSATLNFPSIAASLHIPHNSIMSPKSVQRVAAAAANSLPETAMSNSPPTPPPSSPPSHHLDEEVFSSMASSKTQSSTEEEQLAMMECSYYGFDQVVQSPKFLDQMSGGATQFEQLLLDDFYDLDGDIKLWSFC